MHLCVICGLKCDRQQIWGIKACRACGAFFRRAIAENLNYKCKKDWNCSIKYSNRNRCRGCRLKSCFEAGMNREDIIRESIKPSCSYTAPQKEDYPTLEKITDSIKGYLLAEKAGKIAENSRPFVHSMLAENFDLFSKTDPKERAKLVNKFSQKFGILLQIFNDSLTIQNCNPSNMHEPALANHLEISKKIKSERIARRFEQQNFTISDVAAISYLVFMYEIKDLSALSKCLVELSNAAFQETYRYCLSKFGVADGALKFCNIVSITQEILDFMTPRINFIPQLFTSEIVMYGEASDISILFSQLLEDHVFDVFDEKLVQELPYMISDRRISSSKLSMIGYFAQVERIKDLTSSIFCGMTFSRNIQQKAIKLSEISSFFDETLIHLANCLPADTFYAVKTFMNLNFVMDPISSVKYLWKQIFCSPYKMDIEMNVQVYVFGKLTYIHSIEDLAMDEILFGLSKYYIYHVEYEPTTYGQGLLHKLLTLSKEIIETICTGYSLLLILKERTTQEILLVIPVIFAYDPNFSGYQLYRIEA